MYFRRFQRVLRNMKQWSSSSLFAGVCFSATLLGLYQTDWKLDHQASMFGSSPNKFHCELCCSRKKKTITYLPLPPSRPVQTIVERLTLTTVTFIFGWVVSDLNTQEHTTAPLSCSPANWAIISVWDGCGQRWLTAVTACQSEWRCCWWESCQLWL